MSYRIIYEVHFAIKCFPRSKIGLGLEQLSQGWDCFGNSEIFDHFSLCPLNHLIFRNG